VALPLARPALAAGVALALMETLNDIGAVEFFGVRTLTVAVYDTWLDGHPGLHPRLALSLPGGRALGAHRRSRQPPPGSLAARDHRREPAWRLDKPPVCARDGPGMGVAHLLITQENAGVGLAIVRQSG
jgi:hypothetical protein